MTEPKESGLSSPDPENEHHHPPRPHLCSACSQIDFKALFTTHKRRNDMTTPDDETPETCTCLEILEARQKSGWPGPESTDQFKPPCSLCAFYKECLLRSKDIALYMKNTPSDFRTGLLLKGFHSLKLFWVEHEECRWEHSYSRLSSCEHYVQDIFALQFVEKMVDPGFGVHPRYVHGDKFYPYPDKTMGHAILRIVDAGPKFSALTRAREAGGGLLARRILPDQVNYNLIGEWLSLCLLGHTQCHGDGDGDGDVVTIPGFRVIDCTTGIIVSAVEASDNGAKRGQLEYVTLSYVWGQAECGGPILREHGLSLPNELPLVISDAIEVVKRVGYRYLWIDRYCIPQDDLSARQIQIKSMERIYSCSVLTIIAAAGDGPEYGLPGVSSRHRPEQLCVQMAEGISLALYESPKVLVAASRWHTRGWTYQEGLLSKRRLIFTDQLVYFQCYEMHGDEVLSIPLPGAADFLEADGRQDQFGDIRYISFEHKESDFGSVFPRRVADWSDPGTIWDRIKEFAQRRLAFDADTLDAIAGIFGRYSSKTKAHGILFFCGLPITPIQVDPIYSNAYADNCGPGGLLMACSFQQLPSMPLGHHLCSSITRGNGPDSSSVNDISNSPTYKLVYSLLWSDCWNHMDLIDLDPTSIPVNRKQVRRSVFPSWSWAGWKTCIIKHKKVVERPFYLDICTMAHVEFEDEAGIVHRLDWETQNEEILNLTLQGDKIPACLTLRGTVLDIKLKFVPDEWDSLELGTYTWPPFLEGEMSHSLPRFLCEDGEDEGGSNSSSTMGKRNENVSLLGLLLAIEAWGSSTHNFLILMLRPVKRSLNGRIETMYERVHLLELLVTQDDHEQVWSALPRLLREAEVRLC